MLTACKSILDAVTTLRLRPIYVAGLVADVAGYEGVPALVAMRAACLRRFTGRTASADRAELQRAIVALRAHVEAEAVKAA